MRTRVQSALRYTSAPETSKVAGRSLGFRNGNLLQIDRQLRRGLSWKALVRFQKYAGLTLDAIRETLQIPRRTLARRKLQGRLTPLESERLFRLADVVEKAVSLFDGDTAAARQWLAFPQRALGNEPPLTVVRTDIGAREVERLIGCLEHGVFV